MALDNQLPSQYAPQMQDISQQKRLAELLQQQALQQPQGQMVSGRYVAPSITQYLTPLMQAYVANKTGESVSQKEQELANLVRNQGQQETTGIMQALQGTPAQTVQQAGPTPEGGNIAPQQVAAVPGNQQEALAMALRAQTPQGQAMLAPLMANVIPKKTELQQEFDQAKGEGFKGSFMDYKNQLTPYQKAELGLRGAELNKSQVVETPQGVVLVNPRTGSVAPAMLNGQPIMGKNNQTESQAKANVFHNQMTSATNELNRIQNEGFNPNSKVAQTQINMAGGMFNTVTPSEAQQFKQAQNQWTEAYLRFKTGAGTNAHEIEANRQTYFPVFGDSPQQVALKNRMRTQAENDMAIAAGKNAQFSPAPQPLNTQNNTQNAPLTPSAWGKATVVQ